VHQRLASTHVVWTGRLWQGLSRAQHGLANEQLVTETDTCPAESSIARVRTGDFRGTGNRGAACCGLLNTPARVKGHSRICQTGRTPSSHFQMPEGSAPAVTTVVPPQMGVRGKMAETPEA
jgi:hypothetical protein